MNTEALLRLADKLEGTGPYSEIGPVPREKFDMSSWCGTAACAAGHACSDPWFIERGLKLEKTPETHAPVPVYYVGRDAQLGFTALMFFFDISLEDASRLFCPVYYPESLDYITPKRVADRIRDKVHVNGC
jgi:hypothetical protein